MPLVLKEMFERWDLLNSEYKEIWILSTKELWRSGMALWEDSDIIGSQAAYLT